MIDKKPLMTYWKPKNIVGDQLSIAFFDEMTLITIYQKAKISAISLNSGNSDLNLKKEWCMFGFIWVRIDDRNQINIAIFR